MTGQYAPIDLYYDASANEAALDYDGARIVAWQNVGTTTITNFDKIGFAKSGSTAGDIFIDNITFETFPADAWSK